VLRHRDRRGNRNGAGCRCDPGPHLLWQHDQKERDIARAFALGIRLFAVDCAAEVEKISRAAPGAKVFCRILYDCAGAEWPLSRKFGCDPEMAVDVLDLAKLGLEPWAFRSTSVRSSAR
jgi:diaminopimelate decarboxylase